MRASAPAFSFAQALREQRERSRGGDVLVLHPKATDDLCISYKVRTRPTLTPHPPAVAFGMSGHPYSCMLMHPSSDLQSRRCIPPPVSPFLPSRSPMMCLSRVATVLYLRAW